VVLHWPRPDVPLLEQDGIVARSLSERRNAPIAFVSRMDPWRKGLDRLCAWVSENAATLPRPAVVLLVPRGVREPPQLHNLVEAGLIEWDSESRGAALKEPLQRCRGAMLLSRFDAQPRSLREALWLGLPILCTPECGFDDILANLGSGKVVRGDRPAEIQAAFESLAEETVDTKKVHQLLNRGETGRFLLSVLVTLGAGQRPHSNYFDQPLESTVDPRLLTSTP
jgi:glycosyltransferase involved in cell wall biosynthesis